jgi:hypothetical protein
LTIQVLEFLKVQNFQQTELFKRFSNLESWKLNLLRKPQELLWKIWNIIVKYHLKTKSKSNVQSNMKWRRFWCIRCLWTIIEEKTFKPWASKEQTYIIPKQTLWQEGINDETIFTSWKKLAILGRGLLSNGRNKQNPLNDDDFLVAHWIMYFQYTREGDDYIRFLPRAKIPPLKMLHTKSL